MAALQAKAMSMANKLMALAKPQLEVFLKYAKVELTPPSPGDIPAITQQVNKLIKAGKDGAWKKTTVREAWLNTLVTMEVCFWFYMGECIGKHHIVGYNV